jgi:hypothetical protein
MLEITMMDNDINKTIKDNNGDEGWLRQKVTTTKGECDRRRRRRWQRWQMATVVAMTLPNNLHPWAL